jgi:membrane protein YdbS with pleckstrin-like domain
VSAALREPERRLPAAARTMWRVQLAGLGLVASAVAAMSLGVWGLGILALAVVVVVVVPELLWRRWRYEVREEEIDLRHGLLSVKRTLVPIRRVQHVDTESGPVQGMFDLATVSFHTAAGKTEIPALTRGEAESVRRRVAELARTRDDV